MPTTESTQPRLIVVGVEGYAPGLAAAQWAATEAALRHARLHVVHSYAKDARPPATTPQCDAQRIVTAAVNAARAQAPHLTITAQTCTTPAAEVLVELSSQAHLVVLGHRGHGPGSPLPDLGSPIVSQVAAHARGPLAVVRPAAAAPSGAGPIVVGVDGSTAADTALGFAFAEAALRHLPLQVVRAWPAPPDGADRAEIDAVDRRLCESVQPWRDAFPHLPVQVGAAPGRPLTALAQASRAASLLVVGARGGGDTGARIGSVAKQLIHLATCPVAVVRPVPRPDQPTSRLPAAYESAPAAARR
jgi:nucleotide-binding universal stress UspA family protein